MAGTLPTTRTDFKAYILRKLGDGVTQINVSDDQVEDRIAEALSFFQDFHYDATERTYLLKPLTASTMVLDPSSNSAVMANGEPITGATSNAHGTIWGLVNSSVIAFSTANGSFQAGELITGQTSGGSVILNSDTTIAIANGDIDNRYITLPSSVINVVRMVQPYGGVYQSSSEILFNLNLQLRASDMWQLQSTSMIPYFQARQHLALIDRLLNADVPIRFHRHMHMLEIDWNWSSMTQVGMVMLFECFKVIDPDTYSEVWSDRYLRDYATALVKKQWGQNLLKLSGISLPGGVTLDAEKINSEAKEEIEKLEEKIVSMYSLPPEFIVG